MLTQDYLNVNSLTFRAHFFHNNWVLAEALTEINSFVSNWYCSTCESTVSRH